MRAEQLQRAARSILAMLQNADVLTIIRQCRGAADGANSQEKQLAHARLEHAGAVLMKSIEAADRTQRLVLKSTHLDSLGTTEYWEGLLSPELEDAARQAEFVRLYSRVLFATSHLPTLLNLLEDSSAGYSADAYPESGDNEEALTVKLVDAGEKASDPDRVARAIDGLDMLYSACASLAQKATMDLQLLGIRGYTDRDITLRGDKEAMKAVKTVLESIPDAVADINPEDEIDVQELVQSLPIFGDLHTLKKLGTFLPSDLQDINDTMYQGVLLSLESGILLMEDDDESASEPPEPEELTQQQTDELTQRRAAAQLKESREKVELGQTAASPIASETASDKDEYYDQYLRERDKLQQGSGSSAGKQDTEQASHNANKQAKASNQDSNPGAGKTTDPQNIKDLLPNDSAGKSTADDKQDNNAIDNLIKGLKG